MIGFFSLSVFTAYGQSNNNNLQINLSEEIMEIKNEIQESNKNDDAFFWITLLTGEIIAGVAIVATIIYARELQKQNNILNTSYEDTKKKNMVDAIHELEKIFLSPKIISIHSAIIQNTPLLPEQGTTINQEHLVDYLSLIGKIYLHYEVGVISIEYIDKIFGTRTLSARRSSNLQKYFKKVREEQGESAWKHIDLLADLIIQERKKLDPNDPTIKDLLQPSKTKDNNSKLQRTYPKGYEPNV